MPFVHHWSRLCVLIATMGIEPTVVFLTERCVTITLHCNLRRCAAPVAEWFFESPNTTHLVPFICRLLSGTSRFLSIFHARTRLYCIKALVCRLGHWHYPFSYWFTSWFSSEVITTCYSPFTQVPCGLSINVLSTTLASSLPLPVF